MDGIANTNRVNPLTYRKIAAKVVDTILNSRTYAARVYGQAKQFNGKFYEIPLKVTEGGQGQFFTGLETLNSSATDTLVSLQYAHTAYSIPVVSSLLESMANSGDSQVIDLDRFKYEEAAAEGTQQLGTAIYSTGSANQPLGLGAIVDDGTDVGTIGNLSRSIYTVLQANRDAASGGVLSLTFLAQLEDAVTASGVSSEEPNLNLTTKTIWSLYEQLLQPQVRADYGAIGMVVPLRGKDMVRTSEIKGGAGFTALSYRAKPVIKDDACTTGNWFMLNENYLEYRGRTIVPDAWKGLLEKVSMGDMSTTKGVMNELTPPSSAGWFWQKRQVMPNQAGSIGRFYVVGQFMGTQFRRQSRGTGITTV